MTRPFASNYIGQVRYRQEIHPGEQPAIVDPALWQKVQELLERRLVSHVLLHRDFGEKIVATAHSEN